MTKAILKERDVVSIRQYTYRGISVLVKIDRARKEVSFVEPTSDGSHGYKAKKWVFNDRTADYVRTWTVIMEAMKLAAEAALAELDELSDREFNNMVKMLAAMSEAQPTKRKK